MYVCRMPQRTLRERFMKAAPEASNRLIIGFLRKVFGPDAYIQDGLVSLHRSNFTQDPAFQRAYARGMKATDGTDLYLWHWRVHIALWASTAASHLEGDFVECGVNYGFMSSAIMENLDWDRLGKTFYLLDTFSGLDPRFISAEEQQAGTLDKNADRLVSGFYVDGVEGVRANFRQWKNQQIIVGSVPETLEQVHATKVAYLALDMNCAPPELAALRHFWPRLVPGGIVLLDDYGYMGFEEQGVAFDELAKELGISICALPTGQGLIIRPPH